jgi:POT family proton-dependent oligopeptide transporter
MSKPGNPYLTESQPSAYLTEPRPSAKMPPGIPYIVGNEAAERFSFYGMNSILAIYMTTLLLDSSGVADPMSDAQATSYVHLFKMSAYFFPILGAILADGFLGKYRTIMTLSIVYCLGHFALAMEDVFYWLKPTAMGDWSFIAGYESRYGLAVGLFLIAVGSGGIKPCVSAHVGDQFGAMNQHLLSRVFAWFYFAINLGALISTFLTPVLREWYGPSVAFGVPGVLMFVATFVFWMGRHKFVHVPAGGMKFVKEAFSGTGLRAILHLIPLYIFIAMFWALFDQTASRWVLQARNMDRHLFGHEWLPDQIGLVNPLFVLAFIPLFTYVVYPAINRFFPLTPLRKIGGGLFLAVLAFSISAWIESWIVAGERPTILWQILAYVTLTAAEIMVSITSLEFSYTQAPNKMKSFVMGLYLLSVSAGNAFTTLVNVFIQNADGTSKLAGADYYWFFTAAMLVTAIVFVPFSYIYRGRVYVQGQE